jgi:hypothetical protein
MNYDLATADELVAEAREARRRAEETARTYSWAARQQEVAVNRSIPVPLGDLGNIDWEEAKLARKRAAARRELGNALEQSGLAERWRKTDQADAELKEYFASDGYRTGGIGKLMKLGANR